MTCRKIIYCAMQCIIQTPTPALLDSLAFYETLGFQSLEAKEDALLTDGTVIIHVNDNKYARAGLKLRKPSWKTELEKMVS